MTLRRSSLVLVALAAILASMFAAPAQSRVATAPDGGKGAAASSPAAQAALANVRAILGGEHRGGKGLGESGAPADPAANDATLALRDLALLKDQLAGADRKEANELLARPATTQRICSTSVCVHYTPGVADAGYANTVLNTVQHVHDSYVAAGYRAPKRDGIRGGDGRTDIYLQDVGDERLYGYCTSDQGIPQNGPYDAWAYCVLDNDYSPAQFPTNTPTENLQVTAAHEYFHAVQFGYDIAEDAWFMEATAAWVEDEMYDAVDDNLQYLRQSPLRLPRVPMDTFGGSFHYGTWIFFRYLSERWRTERGGLPVIVRDMWRKADARRGAPDKYSIQAVKIVLKSRKAPFEKTFAKFANANRRPAQTYSEGRANRYKAAPLADSYKMRKNTKRSASFKADHLTSKTYRFKPARALRSLKTKLRVNLKMAPVGRGSAAVASVKLKSGDVRVIKIRINSNGTGSKRLPFSARRVKSVELTLANASTRYRCWVGGNYSCQGTAKDENVTESFRATVVR